VTDTLFSPAVPAGWYDDPSSPDAYRWWSGANWTEHTAPKQAPPVVAPTADPWPTETRIGQGTLAVTDFSRDPAVLREHGLRTDLAPEDLADKYARIEKAGTAGVWLLAFLPWISVLLSIAAGGLVYASGEPLLGYAFTPVALGLAWLFAALDVRALKARGFRPPSILWMLLLPPLGYLIARGRVLRAQRGRAWPPELVYFVNVVLLVLAMVLLAFSVRQYLPADLDATLPGGAAQAPAQDFQDQTAGPLADVDQPWQPQIETALQTRGGYESVDCSQAEPLMAPGATFNCEAVSAGSRVMLSVTLTTLGEIQYTEYPLEGELTQPVGPDGGGSETEQPS
jgi:hypothetical protein